MFISSKKNKDLWIFSFFKFPMLFLIFMFVFYGCGSVAVAPPSSIGLFGNTPEQQPNEGIRRVSESKIIPDFTFDEVFDAASRAALMLGLNIEKKDLEKGMMTGNGLYTRMVPNYGPHKSGHTFAFYIEEISDEPQTKFTILVDTHSYDTIGDTWDTKGGYIWVGEKFIEAMFAETLKILATIR
jgi:hypothetical protein